MRTTSSIVPSRSHPAWLPATSVTTGVRIPRRTVGEPTGAVVRPLGPPKGLRYARRPTALVAQRIEHRPPEPCAQVRVLPRALELPTSMQVSGLQNVPRFPP